MNEYLYESVWQTINMKDQHLASAVTALANQRASEGWAVVSVTQTSAPARVGVMFSRAAAAL